MCIQFFLLFLPNMQSLVVTGGQKLSGSVAVSGAKNVALKAIVAACLTDEPVTLQNVPYISDVDVMLDIAKDLGAVITKHDHTITITVKKIKSHEVSLEKAARLRASSLFIAPLLSRIGEAIIPNPGGCRLGARPIDRIIDGIRSLGADIVYHSEDGYFHAKAKELHGTTYHFDKNTHTGTETLILVAVLAKGKTVLHNAAEEPEIDDLITLLNLMGARVQRSAKREITITGVESLHGTTFTISPDRNEIVTFAIAALVTNGDITVEHVNKKGIEAFLEKLTKAGAGFEETKNGMRFFSQGLLHATDVITAIYPGFMTDWQAPWTVLMTQAHGISTVHETIFENKMGYITELNKMGARISPFIPQTENVETFYNFNLSDDKPEYVHAIKINGPQQLHNAIITMEDIRAGAAVVLAALAAKGTSTIFGVEKLDRGYESFEKRLQALGAIIERK
ncbi:MAG TPA: UDP-N-acetylglucosamine 1-carboxyvinyltransferase [Patescibacteria group bacterium]|nr:UDP-N-acetylglucosamine 1-carboxyvinyltransferase [Patescibacteria group bacterium]